LIRDLFLRCGLYCNFLYIPEALAQIRLHPNAKSSAEKGKWAEELPQMYKQIFTNKRLPPNILHLKNETIGHAYLKAAQIAWQTNQRYFSYLLRSVFWHPKIIIQPKFMKLLRHLIA